MEAGIELDAKVAEEIFDEPWPIAELYFRDIGNGWLVLAPRSSLPSPEANCRINDVLPKFSFDMTAAFEVVKKLEKGSFALAHGPEHWTAGFSIPSGMASENAETAPHAICLAALKAVGYTMPPGD